MRCALTWLSLLILLVLGFGTNSLALERLKLATTTSTENSGLLKQLHPVFEKKYGVFVHTISVGTGKALRLGQNGDVDVVLVHAKKSEDLFMERGYGVRRRAVMYNDFVIVGPASDPAGVFRTFDVSKALLRIKNSESLWFSREMTLEHTRRKESFGKVPALVCLVPGIALWAREWAER